MNKLNKVLCSLFIVLAVVLALPFNVKAEEQITALNLADACKEEGISFDHPNFENKEGKANIYVFRGEGCPHCQEFLAYLESIVDTYGDKFNVITFETWNNSANKALMSKVGEKFGEQASGVPYIVIGKKTFKGYSSASNKEITAAIDDLYSQKANDRYDVMNELDNDGTVNADDTKVADDEKKAATKSSLLGFFALEIINLLVFAVIYVNTTRKYAAKIDSLKDKVSTLNNEIKTNETKKVVKKETVKKTAKKSTK